MDGAQQDPVFDWYLHSDGLSGAVDVWLRQCIFIKSNFFLAVACFFRACCKAFHAVACGSAKDKVIAWSCPFKPHKASVIESRAGALVKVDDTIRPNHIHVPREGVVDKKRAAGGESAKNSTGNNLLDI